jgi:hypothetical protein
VCAQVLFWLYPQHTGAVGIFFKCWCMTQQALLPLPQKHTIWDVSGAVSVTGCRQSWSEYYNSQHSAIYVPASEMRGTEHTDSVMLYSVSQPPAAKSIGGGNVELYTSRDEGTWYPGLPLQLAWCGGPIEARALGTFFAPCAEHLTCQLALSVALTEHCSLRKWLWTPVQQLANLAGGSGQGSWLLPLRIRGNAFMADLTSKPKDWTLEQWRGFAGLRAYPLQQLRALCVALKDRALLLNDPQVRHVPAPPSFRRSYCGTHVSVMISLRWARCSSHLASTASGYPDPEYYLAAETPEGRAGHGSSPHAPATTRRHPSDGGHR